MPSYRIYFDGTASVDIEAETHEEKPAKDGQPARILFKDKDAHVVGSFAADKVCGFIQREVLSQRRTS